jgi:hypothetical protein
MSYERKKFEIGVSVQNLFDVRWKETQFDTESKLQNETTPVSEIHFTSVLLSFLRHILVFSFNKLFTLSLPNKTMYRKATISCFYFNG